MTLSISLEVLGDLSTLTRTPELEVNPDWLGQEDELLHVLAAQCRALTETGKARFLVGGFGDPSWRVDVRTDLAVVLEQLPGVMRGLRNEGREFEVNFFEQGIEAYLAGERRGDSVRFQCTTTRMNWTPDPDTEVASLADVLRMFRDLTQTFCSAVRVVCPWLGSASPAFETWRADSLALHDF